MKITSIFDINEINLETLVSELRALSDIVVKVNGQTISEIPRLDIEHSVIDFIDASDESVWLELDFLNRELFFPTMTNSKFNLAATFYPHQDAKYKDFSPVLLKLMKLVYSIVSPLIVFQDDNDASRFLLTKDSHEIDTSFIVFDIRLLKNGKQYILENPDLFHVEMLSEKLVWINGPLGLGDETFHIERRSDIGKYSPSEKRLFDDLQEKRAAHQSALAIIVKSLTINR